MIRYSVNAREKEHLFRIKSDPVQCIREGKVTLLYRIKNDPVQCKREGKGTLVSDQK